MNHIEINKNGNRINLYGNKAIIEKEKSIIEDLELSGIENKDRLIIQDCIDTYNLKSSISYNGNTVYSCKKIVNEYRKLQKTGTLDKLTKTMYHFFTNACNDIAHYDIGGYIGYYNNSLRDLENNLLNSNYLSADRFSDRDNIFKKLKIGKYFVERANIDIDSVSIKRLKEFINSCKFEVNNDKNVWEFSIHKKDYNVDTIENGTTITFKPSEKNNVSFSFKIEVPENKPSYIIEGINNYYKTFNKDDYICEIYEKNKEISNAPKISEIVSNTNYFVSNLSMLADNVLYKCKNEAEILADSIKNIDKQYDYDLELEM